MDHGHKQGRFGDFLNHNCTAQIQILESSLSQRKGEFNSKKVNENGNRQQNMIKPYIHWLYKY